VVPFLFLMQEIDIMIPLGGGSHNDDIELRMTLRSIDKHISGVRNIYIVGKCPAWVCNVIHVPMEDEHPCKETNIYRKILAACKLPTISDDFLFFNDDHFILQDFVACEFPYFYKGLLQQVPRKLPPYSKYGVCVNNTATVLLGKGLRERNFDTHTPIIYNKHKFQEIMPGHDWEQRFSYVVKSLYANLLEIEGVKVPDCKINDKPSVEEFKARIADRPCFSIDNGAFGETLHEIWYELYPTSSRWES
jgi:hypothetical protein